MKTDTDPRYPDISYLRERARQRVPEFIFDYLDGGCNSEINLKANTDRIRAITLQPHYLRNTGPVSLKTTLFGHEYAAPFGVAPMGLQGMIWPGAAEILAAAAYAHNIPYILSTVGTASIETIAEITQGQAWFQLYNPVDQTLRKDLLQRAHSAGYKVLVVLCDTPSFGYRPREIRNGLAMPPRMTPRNVCQMLAKPRWVLSSLRSGQPQLKTLLPYLPSGANMQQLGQFMNQTFSGRLNQQRLDELRSLWPGKLVLKGVVSAEDAEKALTMGADGLIVSNHGGRQLDCGPAAIDSLRQLQAIAGQRITLMLDSGIRTGPDIACSLASGAQFCFLGRAFMYGVAAMGRSGGNQVMLLLKRQLQQVMEQIGAENPAQLPQHLL